MFLKNKNHPREKAPLSFVSVLMLHEVMNRATWVTAASSFHRIDVPTAVASIHPKIQPA